MFRCVSWSVFSFLATFALLRPAVSRPELIPLGNTSLCIFGKQLKLSDDKRLTICNYKEDVRIDIRKFVNDKPSIRGIWLSKEEYEELLRISRWTKKIIRKAEQIQKDRPRPEVSPMKQ